MVDPFATEQLTKDLTSVTESVARAIMPLSGKRQKDRADHIAVETMRVSLDRLNYRFRVLIGEGEKDNAPMLYFGEMLGQGKESDPLIDLIVDPLECTSNFSKGLPDSTVVLAAVPSGTARRVPGSYMEQLLIPRKANIDNLHVSTEEVLKETATALGCKISDLTVVVQDRSRHVELMEEIQKLGAGLAMIDSGSISAAVDVILERDRRAHLLYGTFGAPEGLVMAFLARTSDYKFLGRMMPHNDRSFTETQELGLTGKTFVDNEWVSGSGILCISGVHSSTWLPGVRRHRKMHVTTAVFSIPGGNFLYRHVDGEPVGHEELKRGL